MEPHKERSGRNLRGFLLQLTRRCSRRGEIMNQKEVGIKKNAARLLKSAVYLAVSFILGCALEYLQAVHIPQSTNWLTPEDAKAVTADDFVLYHYSTEDGVRFVPDGEDPQIYVRTGGIGVRTVVLSLAEPVKGATMCEIYYANTGDDFTSEKLQVFFMRPGDLTRVLFIDEPSEKIRIDINGPFTLESLYISPSEAVAGEADPVPFRAVNAVFWMLVFFGLFTGIRRHRVWDGIRQLAVSIGKESKKTVRALLTGLVICMTICSAAVVMFRTFGLHFNRPAGVYTVFFALTVAVFFCFRSRVTARPEWFFAAAAAGIAVFFSLCLPVSRITWDLESHYGFALDMSYLGEAVKTPADRYVEENALLDSYLSRDDARDIEDLLNIADRTDDLSHSTITKDEFPIYALKHTGNIPNAMGLYLGRAMGLSFTGRFRLGRLMNALIYILVFWGAIRILPYGKMVLVCIGLFPTNLLMASNYSYDATVIAWTCLGMAFFLRQYYADGSPFRMKEGLKALGCIALGCLSKAVYFPIVFLTALLPEGRYNGKKQKWIWRLLVELTMLLLVLSFIVPFFGGTQAGDARGGSDVNAGQQIAFIFGNPLTYTRTLLNFLTDYLSVGESYGYAGHYAYLGVLSSSVILVLIMTVVCFTEDYPDTIPYLPLHQAITAVVCFGTISLVATALYISFTPVGADYIAGCQRRYITPVLFPLLAFLHFPGTNRKIDRARYALLVFAVFVLYNYYGIFQAALQYMQ